MQMMKTLGRLGMAIALAGLVAGCSLTGPKATDRGGEGEIAVLIKRPVTSGLSPQAISSRASRIRLRVWNGERSRVLDKALPPEGGEAAYSWRLEQGAFDALDVVTYGDGGSIADGGRSENLTITAGETTTVGITLDAYEVTHSVPASAGSGTQYTVAAEVTGSAPAIFDQAETKALVGSWGSAGDEWSNPTEASFTSPTVSADFQAPEVESDLTLNHPWIMHVSQEWNEGSLTPLVLYSPHETANLGLGSTVVSPTSGELAVTIQ